jgi:sterol desaturase/sphingolipid hydroxylase (fatty acid hydroxylase superfamily)
MKQYLELFISGYQGYANYLWQEITHPHWQNYFYWLIGVSLFFLILEWVRPWRKDQARFRKDFWLDFFYMFFNFFLFSLIICNAASDVLVNLFKDFLAVFGIRNLVAIHVEQWPIWAQLLTLLVIRDFIQWWVHRLLHQIDFLWEFHKVHHSVQQMGFAAHLRFHWMETVVYRSIE